MTLISPMEILDAILMTIAVGFIFKDSFKQHARHDEEYDPLAMQQNFGKELLEACIITAPAVVLHEMAHKGMGLALGLDSVFYASYWGLLIGIVLKVFNSPIVFLVPGYVSIMGGTSASMALTSFAGPAMNGLLWIIATAMLSRTQQMSIKSYHRWTLTKNINGFLFVLNMMPIPGFDGYNLFNAIFRMI